MTAFLFGGDYSPEQWRHSPEILNRDIELMKEAGCTVMTLGVFSWAVLESKEGCYDFSFLDETIDRLYKNGISVILSTPSAAMPRWLAKKHPEALRTDENGFRELGARRALHCPSSKVYRSKVANINEQLAKRYGNHPAVKLWHVSNEYQGCCYCDNCRDGFREWLKKKYNNDLELLNRTLWNEFWSSSFSDWDEIYPPVPKSRSYGSGLYLEWRRFTSELTVDFMNEEAKPLRRYAPNIPVTTNFHGELNDLDYYRFKNDVDIISWDIYPHWHENSVEEEGIKAAFKYDLCYSFKNKPFYLMENTPGCANFESPNIIKRPGMNILASVQAMAHGADMIGFFQWRQGRGGYEKTHSAFVDHSGRNDTRKFRELSQLGALLEKSEEICGTHRTADVAIIYDWENRWALDNVIAFGGTEKKYLETCLKHYAYFAENGINVDVVSQDSDISKYKLVIAPMLYLLKHSAAEHLRKYVENGGTLVSTYITGVVDENDLCRLGGFPGEELRDVFGIWVEETDSLTPGMTNNVHADGVDYEAVDYCEYIHTAGAQTLAAFTEDYCAGMPAVTKNTFGKGTAYYIGFRDNGDYLHCLYDIITADTDHYSPADGVFANTRFSDSAEYLFIQNFRETSAEINIPSGFCTLDGTPAPEKAAINGYGVMILKKQHRSDSL